MTNDPFRITEPTVISFSGGRTSGYMLWRVLQSNNGLPENAMVIFCNTGKEAEQTLKFVHDCEKNWNVKITWAEYRREEPGYALVDYSSASRNGEPFAVLIDKKKYLPNPVARFCTQDLKVNVIKKVVNTKDFVTFIGIRADEPRRVAKMKNNVDEKVCPLAQAGVTKEDVMKFWQTQSFDLGLSVSNGITILGNCDLCFLKGISQKLNIVKDMPERVIWWAEQEKKIGATFRKDHFNYSEMSLHSQKQSSIFDEEPMSCFCGD